MLSATVLLARNSFPVRRTQLRAVLHKMGAATIGLVLLSCGDTSSGAKEVIPEHPDSSGVDIRGAHDASLGGSTMRDANALEAATIDGGDAATIDGGERGWKCSTSGTSCNCSVVSIPKAVSLPMQMCYGSVCCFESVGSDSHSCACLSTVGAATPPITCEAWIADRTATCPAEAQCRMVMSCPPEASTNPRVIADAAIGWDAGPSPDGIGASDASQAGNLGSRP